MARMILDVKDRLVLSNQYRILEKVDPDNAETYARNREIVESGYEISYDWIADHIESEPMKEEACREVFDILDMYRRLRSSYDKLADKSGIDANDVDFPGFDGNNEPGYLAFGEFLNKQGKYTESTVSNSHSRTLEMYQRMLGAFRPLRGKGALETVDIQRIIAEQIHPERRK